MKRLNLFTLLFLLVLSALVFAQGSWTANAKRTGQPFGDVYRFTCTVDSVDTLTSFVFKLGRYDHVYWGTPADTTNIEYPFRIQYTATSTLGSPKLTGYVQGSFDGSNWDAVDTLFTNLTSESRTVADLDLNNKKYPQYRVVVYGVAPNRSDTVFDMFLYCYQEYTN